MSEFSREVWQHNYQAPKDSSVDDTWERQARAASAPEVPEKRDQVYKEFLGLLSGYNAMAGGRITANLGVEGRESTTLYNCVAEETLVQTKEGPKKAGELKGSVQVRCSDGIWRSSEWKSYGKQKLYIVEFEDGFKVRATEGHEWIVNSPKGLKETTTLKLEGKQVPFVGKREQIEDSEAYHEGVRNGCVYGDGFYSSVNRYCILDLFGAKKELVENYFPEATYHASRDCMQVRSLPTHYNEIPSYDKGLDYLRGFVAGLIATDGHIDKRGVCYFSSSKLEELEEIRNIFSTIGCPTGPIRIIRNKSNLGEQYGPNYGFNPFRQYLDETLLIRKDQLERYTSVTVSNRKRSLKVISVTEDVEEEVYCCEQPETRSWCLHNGLITKNCFVHNPQDIGYKDPDSLTGIYDLLKSQAQTLKSEGGYGMNFSWIRPAGMYVRGIASRTPGVIQMMSLWNQSSAVITMGSDRVLGERKDDEKKKIRKGAQMGILNCVSGDTEVSTIDGKIPIKDLVGTNPYVYCTDRKGKVLVRQSNKVWKTGTREVVKVLLDNDDTLVCTPDHKILLKDGTYKEAKDLQFGDSVSVLHKRLYKKYFQLSVTGSRQTIAEHVAVAEAKYGRYPKTIYKEGSTKAFDNQSEVIHHKDGNSINNSPENLELLTREQHSATHHEESVANLKKHQKRIAKERKGKSLKEYYGEEKAKEINEKRVKTYKDNGGQPWNADLSGEEYKSHYSEGFKNQFSEASNPKVVSVSDYGEEDVYDLSVPEFHNFVANGVFVHNCWHPEIEDFIDAKLVEGRLNKFNISVGVTPGFMEAVKSDSDWNLEFPDTECKEYSESWGGDLYAWKAAGNPTTVYKTVKAKDLWDKIMKATYTRNDPGILFLDIANKLNPFYYGETIATTNPCGE